MTIKQVLLDKDYQHIAKQVIEGFVDELDQNILEDILWDNDIWRCAFQNLIVKIRKFWIL